MTTEKLIDDCADVIVAWAHKQARQGRRPPRQSVRLRVNNPRLADIVRVRLERSSDETAWYLVRRSGDPDAVQKRNGRPDERPAGVLDTTPLLYLLFWTPGFRTEHGSHDAVIQSLEDMPAVDVGGSTAKPGLLSDAQSFKLPLESAVEARCADAAQAWPETKRDTAARHLISAWDAVRTVLRERAGGKERSIPFVTELEPYIEFLHRANVLDDEWNAAAPEDRARLLVTAWGRALPALGMFRLPAIGDLLGIPLDPKAALPRKVHDDILLRDLWTMLAENLDAASDNVQLGERIRGKVSLAERLESPVVPLAHDDPRAAAAALLAFCLHRDERAFDLVDWLFRKDSVKKRSESQGLKGLLIQRGARERRDPVERAATESARLLLEALDGSADAQETAGKAIESRRLDVQAKPSNAASVATELELLASGTIPHTLGDAGLRTALEEALRAGRLPTKACDALARSWRNIARHGETAVPNESSLLGGLVRTLAERDEPFPSSGSISVELTGDAGTRLGSPHRLVVSGEGREALRVWFRDALGMMTAAAEEEEDDEVIEGAEEAEDDGRSLRSVRVDVILIDGDNRTSIGQFDLSWSKRAHERLEAVRQDTLRQWTKTAGAKRPSNELAALFGNQAKGAPVQSIPREYGDAWLALHGALGTFPNAAVASVVGCVPARESRAFVDSWSRLLSGVGAAPAQRRLAEIKDEIKRAKEAGDKERLASLYEERDSLEEQASTGSPAIDQATVRSCLQAMTGTIIAGDDRVVYLTPFHPLVLRLRVLEEDALWSCLCNLVSKDTSVETSVAIGEAMEGWGLPEPAATYGGFWEGDPLAFDGWTHNQFARFVPHRPAVAVDLEKLGIGAATRTLQRYLELHPAARDRLAIRVQADADGRWAWKAVTSLDVPTDVALVTTRTLREGTFFEHGATSTEQRRLLEMSDDGAAPRVRVRREGDSDPDAVHAAISIGTSAAVFTPKLACIQFNEPVADTWSERRLFEVAPWERPDGALALVCGRPRFELELRVARAISFGARGASDIHVQRLSIDKEVVRPEVQRLHRRAHWLVVATRHPVHPVIEAAGGDVALLLDFDARRESGRPLHICTSMGHDQVKLDLSRLRGALERLFEESVDIGVVERLIEKARRFAPGLAMTCTGTTSLAHVQGLIGLLLTADTMGAESTRAALAIDQHTALLRGKSEIRSDVLVVDAAQATIELRVLESKLTTKDPLTFADHACVQVKETHVKLAHFERVHPLAARVREDLARAVDAQAEIAARPALRAVAQAVRDPARCIAVAPVTEHEVHVWALARNTAATATSSAEKPRIVVHARDEILKALTGP